MTTILFFIGAAVLTGGVLLLSVPAGMIVGGGIVSAFSAAVEYNGTRKAEKA